MREFIHLHLHSEYSFLDGMCRFKEIARQAKHFGMKAVALTDHGNLHGVVNFYQEMIDQGIKPIVGCEMYLAPGSRKETGATSSREANFHLTVLVENQVGYRNLLKLVTDAYLEGFYWKPRTDCEMLSKYHEGLILMTGCLKGQIPACLEKGEVEKAVSILGRYQEIVGKENVYLELMDNGMSRQRQVNQALVELGKRLGVKLVATNDCHYLRKEDAQAHEVLLCIQTNETVENTDRAMRFETDQFYFRSPEEMEKIFGELPESLDHTLEIAQRCNLEMKFNTYHLPIFHPPGGQSPEDYLITQTKQGLQKKFGLVWDGCLEKPTDHPVIERTRYEVKTIIRLGFASYFLIIQDFVAEARRRGIRVGPGRGSAVGSLVAYLLDITEIDPLKYQLFFERFLNPDRISLPDIDVDFCDYRREEVIHYLRAKYGEECVAQIGTFGTMAARAVVKDVGRALNISFSELDRITKLISSEPGANLKEEMAQNPEIKSLIQADPRMAKLFDISLKLEGLARHASIHAAGVVITDRPVSEYVPLFKNAAGGIATQLDMTQVDKVGLLKVDLLGLKTLSVIQETIELVRQRKGIYLDEFPLDDAKTYQLLSEGYSLGVFQLESKGMQDLLRQIKPEKFEDLIAVLALYRPGVMKSGTLSVYIQRRKNPALVQYDHPLLEPILKSTYGVIVYQEQAMQIANQFSNLTMAEADYLRKAMSKKDREEMEKLKERFIAGGKQRGVPEKTAENVFSQVEQFASYGFNKSHSTGYALLSYQTAYLKANFPLEFMTALLNSEIGDAEKTALYIAECDRMNIWILPPDISESDEKFKIMGNDIYFGLSSIKNVGSGAIRSILKARESGPFKSLFDFCERVDLRAVNRKVIESLIKAGAFDFLEMPRSQLFALIEEAVAHGNQMQKLNAGSQMAIFSEGTHRLVPATNYQAIKNLPEWSEAKLLAYEKEMVGVYLTGHPLEKTLSVIETYCPVSLTRVKEVKEGTCLWVGGIVVSLRRLNTRKGERMAVAELEDMEGKLEVVFYPRVFEESSSLLRTNTILFVKGRVEHRGENAKIVAEEVANLNTIAERVTQEVEIDLILPVEDEKLEEIKRVCLKHRGRCPVFINLIQPGFASVKVKSHNLSVNPTLELAEELKEIIGEKMVRIR
ncbi:MAG: DNA polymerase III subunit alpha [Candidatus Omnitrophica bacterium]|nr:DNA polymerase III subunit alpha [Candidatus Omnitrophota bacterium]